MWVELSDEAVVKKTMEALKGRGVQVKFLGSKEDALKRLTGIYSSRSRCNDW